MANPKSNFALIFTASMSLVFMLVALSTLVKTQESIITQLGYQSPLVLLSLIATLSILAMKICYPKWWNNLNVVLWKNMCLQTVFEFVLTVGSTHTIENSKVCGWDRIFAAFALSLSFVAASFVTGQRLNFAALSIGGMTLNSGFGFWKETGSGIPAVISSVMFLVVLVGVNYANPPSFGAACVKNDVHNVEKLKGGDGIKGVKVSESGVKIGES